MWDKSIDGQDDTMPWIDRTGISILAYAVAANTINVVREILKIHESRKSHLLAWRFQEEGVVEIGFPGHSTCLYGAMCFASDDIVVALLEAGADVETTDVMGSDSFMAACGMGRLNNVMMWCSRFKNWNIDQKNEKFGSTALHVALYMGPRKIDLIKYLVRYIYSSLQNYELYSYNSFQNTSHETLVSKPDSRQKG
jgi:transcriptional/translational regulatory protein YebC/TACO1